MAEDRRRPGRVAEAIRAELARQFVRELGDPLLASLVVTNVSVTNDLSIADVGVRLLEGDADPARRRAAQKHLARASHRIRRALAPTLGMRRVPELRFRYDTGHDAIQRVEELLAEIERERPPLEDDDER